MLSNPSHQPRQPQRQSLRQEYKEFVDQRVEEFKEQLSRAELLSLGDEAIRELEMASEEQLVLTEVLVLEHVNRLIMHRLNLPTFRRWRSKHLKLRKAQQDAAYWGVDSNGPIPNLASRWDESDTVLAVGEGAIPASMLLAAYQWNVVFIDPSLTTVGSVEKLAASEELAVRYQAYVGHLNHWLPTVTPSLVVLDSRALNDLDASARMKVLTELKRMTRSGGIHCFPPVQSTIETLAPAIIRAYYSDWSTRHPANESTRWFLAVKP